MNYALEKFQANIFTIIGIIVLILTYFLKIQISIFATIFLSLISFYGFRIFFEYQRITLIIARYTNFKRTRRGETEINVPTIQMCLGSSLIGFGTALDQLLTGFLLGVILQISLIYFVCFIIFKFFLLCLIDWIPIPFKFFFKTISKQLDPTKIKSLLTNDYQIFSVGVIFFYEIVKTLKEIPHNKHYEDWMYKKMLEEDGLIKSEDGAH